MQYDETNFVNIAMGSKFDSFSTIRLAGKPVLLLPYLGALKSYLFYPVFAIFGFSAVSLRLPVILITALSLYFTYMAIVKSSSKKLALISLLLLSLSPTFISLTRLDVGPNAIELLCKSASLLLFFKFLSGGGRRYLFGLLLVFSFGIVNKLNFIWYVNSFTLAACITYFSDIKNLLLSKASGWSAKIILFIGYFSFFGYYVFIKTRFSLIGKVSVSSIANNLPYFKYLIPGTISGKSYSEYMFNANQGFLNTTLLIFMIIILIMGLLVVVFDLIYTKKQQKSIKRLYFFSWLIVITTLIQILLTSEATAPWHYLTIYPFISIIGACSIYFIYDLVRAYKLHFAIKSLAPLMLIVVLTLQICVYLNYLKLYSSNLNNWYWSDAIYTLSDYTKEQNKQFIFTDWGMFTQVIALDHSPGKYTEAWGTLNSSNIPMTKKEFKNMYLSNNLSSKLFISYVQNRNPQASFIKSGPYTVTNSNFFTVVRELGYRDVIVKSIQNRNGETIYEIHTLTPLVTGI